MRLRLCCCLMLLAVASVARAADAEPPDVTVRLTVRPAAVPVPALKYRLLPELRERSTGNAAFLYYRGFSPEWATWRHNAETRKAMDQWTDTRQVPPKELRWVLDAKSLQEVDAAARRTHCDWELTERVRKEGIALLLPDVQAMREYANLLAIRARFEIADGKYDKAAYTLQTGLQLARHVSDSPTLIQSLVGVAIATIMLRQTDNLIAAPDSPNLYWALTELPRPFIDLRTPLEGERVIVDSMFPGVREALADTRGKPLTAEQTKVLLQKLAPVLAQEWKGERAQYEKYLEGRAEKVYDEAKRFLIAQGRKQEDVEKLPSQYAVLLYEVAHYDELYDEMRKWMSLPSSQARPALQELEKRLKAEKDQSRAGLGDSLALLLIPAMNKVLDAQTRLERNIALLRCVEAVRLYAAGHGGKPPAALGDIKEVPVPADPLTGKPFAYKLDGNQVTLFAPPPAGAAANSGNARRYVLTIQQ